MTLHGVVWLAHQFACKSNGGRSVSSVVEFVRDGRRFPHRFFRCDDQWWRGAEYDAIGPHYNQCGRPVERTSACPKQERDRIDTRTVRPGPLQRTVYLTRFACVTDCLSTNVDSSGYMCILCGFRRRFMLSKGWIFTWVVVFLVKWMIPLSDKRWR